jgi:hypothetical protein
MVIDFSQGLRDEVNCPGWDGESSHIDRACLAEKSKNSGCENSVGGGKFAMRKAMSVPRRANHVCENCETKPPRFSQTGFSKRLLATQ